MQKKTRRFIGRKIRYLYWPLQLPACAACCAQLPCRSAWSPADWCAAGTSCLQAWSSLTEHPWRHNYKQHKTFSNTTTKDNTFGCSRVDAGCIHEVGDVSTRSLDCLKGFLHLLPFRNVTAESFVVSYTPTHTLHTFKHTSLIIASNYFQFLMI